MPYDEPDLDDPTMLIGTEFDATEDDVRNMAYTMAEEFASLGTGEEEIFAMFENPFYASPHHCYTVLGSEEIRSIVRETSEFYGKIRIRVVETASENLVQIGGLK